jgi:hypothetical protein
MKELDLVCGDERLTKREAARLTKQAQQTAEQVQPTLSDFVAQIQHLYAGHADEVLGYETWESYAQDKFAALPRWTRPQRRVLSRELYAGGEGMTQREIASALGVGVGIINDDLHVQDRTGRSSSPTVIDGDAVDVDPHEESAAEVMHQHRERDDAVARAKRMIEHDREYAYFLYCALAEEFGSLTDLMLTLKTVSAQLEAIRPAVDSGLVTARQRDAFLTSLQGLLRQANLIFKDTYVSEAIPDHAVWP